MSIYYQNSVYDLDTPRRGSLTPASPNIAKKLENEENGTKNMVRMIYIQSMSSSKFLYDGYLLKL